jgi:hypothetical protein
MLHRHLNHQGFTLAAIDDVISRGKWDDWAELRQAALADRAILENVARICRAHTHNPYAQRYHFSGCTMPTNIPALPNSEHHA